MPTMPRISISLVLTCITLANSLLLAACNQTSTTNNNQSSTPTSTNNTDTSTSSKGLKIGSLLPTTGDLASVGQQMVGAVPLLVDTVNACGGVNGEQVTLIAVDDQTDPKVGAAGMTKLATLDKVAGVVGSFASSVSTVGCFCCCPQSSDADFSW